MKSIAKPLLSYSWKVGTAIILVIAFSCSKTNDTVSTKTTTSSSTTGSGSNNTVKYCGSITWSNTNTQSGNFTGTLVNNVYELKSVTYKDNSTSTPGVVNFQYDASGNLQNQPGITFTYANNILAKAVVDLAAVSRVSGSATLTFDTNGHLTNLNTMSPDSGAINLSVVYTYDINDDPVHIVAHGTQTLLTGTNTIDLDGTADYLTDKPSLLPYVPMISPFTSYFGYFTILSKHLINKLVVVQNVTTNLGVKLPVLNITHQYTYTYDASGKVVSMFHSGNPANIYTFTYSGCN